MTSQPALIWNLQSPSRTQASAIEMAFLLAGHVGVEYIAPACLWRAAAWVTRPRLERCDASALILAVKLVAYSILLCCKWSILPGLLVLSPASQQRFTVYQGMSRRRHRESSLNLANHSGIKLQCEAVLRRRVRRRREVGDALPETSI